MYLRHEDGRYVCLLPMMHVADQQFWDRVNTATGKLAKRRYVGFYEGLYSKVGPLYPDDQIRLDNLYSAFGLTASVKGEELAERIGQLFRGRSGRKQATAAARTNKVHQLVGFHPQVKGVNADLSTWDLLPGFPAKPGYAPGTWFAWMVGLILWDSLSSIVVSGQPWWLRLLFGRDFARVLIDRRNTHVVEQVLRHTGRSLVPWGAAHMPGIYRLLLDAGFVPRKEQWLVVATREDAAGVQALSPHVRS